MASVVLQEEAEWLLRVEAKRAMARMSRQLNDAAAPHHKTHALKSVFVQDDADSTHSEDAPLRFSARASCAWAERSCIASEGEQEHSNAPRRPRNSPRSRSL